LKNRLVHGKAHIHHYFDSAVISKIQNVLKSRT
jgi:hypothetical protein